eukprot:GHVL01034291.1.p1 GENE.GHVL01034291.1~~GHVL01034291.1.p1  ORF type:complete len:481 (+),score=48.56 GHVL01034291.1:93-1535(+)
MISNLLFALLAGLAIVDATSTISAVTYCTVGANQCTATLSAAPPTTNTVNMYAVFDAVCSSTLTESNYVSTATVAEGTPATMLNIDVSDASDQVLYICRCTTSQAACDIPVGGMTTAVAGAYGENVGDLATKLAASPSLAIPIVCSESNPDGCLLFVNANPATTDMDKVLFTKMECAAHMLADTAVIRPVTTSGVVSFTMTDVSTLGVGTINACYCVHKTGLTCPDTADTADDLLRFTNEPVSMTTKTLTIVASTDLPFTDLDMNCSSTVPCSYGTGAGDETYVFPKIKNTTPGALACRGNEFGTTPIQATSGSFIATDVTPGLYDMCYCEGSECNERPILDEKFIFDLGMLKMAPAPIAKVSCEQNAACYASLTTGFALHNVEDKAFLTTKACGSITDNDTIVIADEITDSTSMQVFTFTIPETLALGDYNICACFVGLQTTCAAPGTTANTRNAYKSNIGQVGVTAESAMDMNCNCFV